MRVLQIGKFYPIRGGVEKVMLDLTEGLGSRGVQCDMLCACIEPPKRRTVGLSANARVICVPAWTKAAATMIAPGMITWLRKHCAEYDLIHIHHPDPMAALALKLSGFKGRVVLHWHSDILKQKTIKKFFLPLQNWLLRRADIIVGTSPVYIHESPDLQGFQDKSTFLPIGVDPIEASPHPKAPESQHLLFSLGRFVEYKGYEHIVRAVAELPESYHLVIGGQGPLKAEMEALAETLGVRHRITFLGWVPDEERAQWFASCEAFVLGSVSKTEAFAIVQVEAMSCGKPVVATEIPGSGVPWVNGHGVSGLNVPICDPSAIANAVRAICEGDYASFSAGAKARYESLFTREKMIDGCMEIYSKVFGNGCCS